MPLDSVDEYPAWICADCGRKYGRVVPGHVMTWHDGDRCGWCGEKKPTTEPRDFRYPKFKHNEHRR